MKNFTLSDLNRRPGELVDQALVEPISLTKRGRRQLVLMSARRYDELVGTVKDAAVPERRKVGTVQKVSLKHLRSDADDEQP